MNWGSFKLNVIALVQIKRSQMDHNFIYIPNIKPTESWAMCCHGNIGSWSSKHSTNTLMETCWTRQQDRSNPRNATKSSRRQHKAHLWEVKSTETQPHGPHNSKDPLPMPWCQIQIQFTPQAFTGGSGESGGRVDASSCLSRSLGYSWAVVWSTWMSGHKVFLWKHLTTQVSIPSIHPKPSIRNRLGLIILPKDTSTCKLQVLGDRTADPLIAVQTSLPPEPQCCGLSWSIISTAS